MDTGMSLQGQELLEEIIAPRDRKDHLEQHKGNVNSKEPVNALGKAEFRKTWIEE